ncbi:hypothetical protein BDZ91DRAFT_769017 [Kalaharituber pfeilii]|nr:hypothetical protein BDZ91DRAFT_769017 [Kalaharituber pfeilii]
MARIKKRDIKKHEEEEKAIALAIQAVRRDKHPLSIRAAAEAHDIAFSTLHGRLGGAKPKRIAHADQQLLTPLDEKAIARKAAYTESNIKSAFKACGLIPFNPRVVLTHLLEHSPPRRTARPAAASPTILATPKDSSTAARLIRQRKLLLQQHHTEEEKASIIDELIEKLQHFGIARERDYQLVKYSFEKWKEANKLNVKKSKKELGTGLARVLDGAALEELVTARALKNQLAQDRKSAPKAPKRQTRKKKTPSQRQRKPCQRKAHFSSSSTTSSDSESSSDSSDSSSVHSTITIRTPLPVGHQKPHPPPSPTPGTCSGRMKRTRIPNVEWSIITAQIEQESNNPHSRWWQLGRTQLAIETALESSFRQL